MSKACYGNYMLDTCEGHIQCKEIGCLFKTNQEHGDCDCKYKCHCNLGRQQHESLIRKMNKYGYDTVEQCDCYKLISERIKAMSKEDNTAKPSLREIMGRYAHGQYICKCHNCNKNLIGDNQPIECKLCTLHSST